MDRFLEKRELQEYMGQAQMMLLGAKEKAKGVLSSAQGLLPVDALSTVMFSPLAAHPVYRSESVLRAMQLQQSRQTSLPAHGAQNDALVAVGQTLAWPSSQALLAQSIPEETHPISLFQGFAATYPSLAGKPKKKKTRRKKVVEEMDETVPKTLKQLVHQREKKTRESDRVSMQKVKK
ncbi:hypothetical protein BY458DRAFT_530363 [Sporodiniella umbellata]|nr:hypothetical protein BY458DRAFT_530363 [Sporodiniella umbellata]